MALVAGVLTQPIATSTGPQDFNVGFEPKFAIVLLQEITAVGLTDTWHLYRSIGAVAKNSTGTTNQWVCVSATNDAAGVSVTARELDSGVCAQTRSGAGTLRHSGVGSIISTGLRITWNTVSGTAYLCTVIAVGGGDIDDCDCVTATVPLSPDASWDINVGFQPTFALFGSVHVVGNAVAAGGALSLGAFDGSGQWNVTGIDQDAVSTMNTLRSQRTDCVIQGIDTAGAVLTSLAAVSFTPTGVELNADPVNGDARIVAMLAVKGAAQFKVGTFTQPATNTTVDVTPGFQTELTLFASYAAVAGASAIADWILALGAQVGVSTTEIAALTTTSRDNIATSAPTSYFDDTKALRLRDNIGTSDVGTMLIDHRGSTQFRTNWTDVDGTQRQVCYVAIGAASSGGGGGSAMAAKMAHYRRLRTR